MAWGVDNRTCALRVVGDGPSVHVETRVPGGDVNPYVAVAALLAAGLHGIEHELPLEPPVTGNAYVGDAPRVPSTLTAATELFEQSAVAPRRSATTWSTTTRTRRASSSPPSSLPSPTGSASVASNASDGRARRPRSR